MKLIFLGSGGGRHMLASQVRRTGGIYADLGDVRFVIDPGPGSIVNARSIKLKIEQCNGLFLSHLHIDHSTDANAYIDFMKEPFVVAEKHCIVPKQKKDDFDYYPCISLHHQKLAKHIKPMGHNNVAKIGSLEISSYECKHSDPAVGFVIKHPKVTIGYPSDGIYYMGMEKFYDGCDLLILNVLVPKGMEPERNIHMSIDDAIQLVKGMEKKPKAIVMQHFGFWMLQNNIFKQCKILQDAVKVPVIQAEDFMEIDLSTMKYKVLK